MQRCYNPSHHNYQRYGGRGIKVCEDWHTIEGFLAWANNSYDSTCDGKTLDRIDNNGNYEPGNCRWATPKEQMNNRRNTSKFTINGVTKPLSEWCDDYHMPLQVVSARIRCLEWDVLKSLTTPVMRFDERGKVIEINGIKKTVKQWSDFYGISISTIYGRMRKGMNAIDAITTPLSRRSRE